MPTQTLSREEIARTYGGIADFVAPAPGHPISHGLPAATVTDDTEQTLLLARQIIASPEVFDEASWARQLIDWEAGVKRRGLHDLLGPSTKRALESLLAGAPASEVGRHGHTNGAAMRIAPVGIAVPVEPLSALIDKVEASCRLTHNTAAAISAASAVAAAISAAVDGASADQAIAVARAAARAGEGRGHDRNRADVAERIDLALEIAGRQTGEAAGAEIAERIGTSVDSRESVPAAFAVLKLAEGDAWQAGLLGANIGGDTDTIGAIAAGMAGACGGASSLPEDKLSRLLAVNRLDLDPVVAGLLELRRAATRQAPSLERAL
jgi:ADP-ribosylglycohydrolase